MSSREPFTSGLAVPARCLCKRSYVLKLHANPAPAAMLISDPVTIKVTPPVRRGMLVSVCSPPGLATRGLLDTGGIGGGAN